MNVLPNDTKIRFCNAVNKLSDHTVDCNQCNVYVRWADGDMCDKAVGRASNTPRRSPGGGTNR